MRTSEVLEAIEALEKAGDALSNGNASIAHQIYLSTQCRTAAYRLRDSIVQDCPQLKISEPA